LGLNNKIFFTSRLIKENIMKVELYLKNINQEMIDAGRISSAKLTGAERAWTVSWPKSCCVLDFSMPSMGEEVINPVRGFIMRAEKEGGMMWEPKTGAVYKLDEEAYHTLLDLDQGFSKHEVAKRVGVTLDSVDFLSKTISRTKTGK
jgi:hypothetical protein